MFHQTPAVRMRDRFRFSARADPALYVARPADPEARSAIFVIDHDAAVRDALSVILRAHGYAVSTFGSAGEFLDMRPAGRQGCILVEFDLADMSGTALIARLRAQRIHLPTIIMSARLRLPIAEDRLPPGVAALLQKPFGQDELLHGLERALGP